MSGSCRETLPDVQKWWEAPQMSGSGQETLPVVPEWW